jgi:amphi-Trp domain-containing protein
MKDRREAAAVLRQIADKLATGEITLRQGESEVALEIPDRVELELKAEEETKHEKVKRSLEIEIEWTEGDSAGGAVSIS